VICPVSEYTTAQNPHLIRLFTAYIVCCIYAYLQHECVSTEKFMEEFLVTYDC